MKKHLQRLAFTVWMGGMAWAGSAQETGTKILLPAGVTPHQAFVDPSTRNVVPCGPDTLAYPYLKELVFAAPNDSFFVDAMVGNVRTASQAYLNSSPIQVLGVQFWGAAYSTSPAPQTLQVRAYLYAVDAFNMPTAVLDSANVTITEQYEYYEAMFAAPHAHNQNFAVGVRSVPNDTLAIISNNAGNVWTPNYGEGLAWRRFGSGAWNSSLSFFGQDLEYMIFPIVTYTVQTEFTGDASLCAGETATFSNASSALYGNRFFNLHAFDEYWGFTAADSSFTWNAGEGADVSAVMGFSHTYNTAGTYDVTLESEFLGYYSSCTGSDTLTVTVNPIYNVTAADSICEGDSYAFGSQTLTVAGTYTETFAGAGGCDSTVTLTLSVNPVYTETDTVTICQGDTYTLGTQSLSTAGVYTEVFAAATGCDSTVHLTLLVNPVYTETETATICSGDTYTFGTQTLSMAGTYTEVFASGLGCDSTVTLTLTVNSTNAVATANGGTLSATPAGGTYQWIDCTDNSPIGGATGQTYTATANGSYAVVVTANNCSDTSACVNVTTLSVTDAGANGVLVTLYPNPATDRFIVDGHGLVPTRIRMVDATGKILVDSKPVATVTDISTEGLAQALYFVYVSVGENTQVFKVIKK